MYVLKLNSACVLNKNSFDAINSSKIVLKIKSQNTLKKIKVNYTIQVKWCMCMAGSTFYLIRAKANY